MFLSRKLTVFFLGSGAEKVSSGIVWGSEKLGEFMAHVSTKLQESSPAAGSEGGVAQTHIDPKWQSTAQTARYVSGKAVKVSSYIRESLKYIGFYFDELGMFVTI